MKRLCVSLCSLLFLVITTLTVLVFSAHAYSNPGPATAFVNDFTNTLSAGQKEELNNKLTRFSSETSNEIAIAIISSLDGDTIEDYAVKLFEDWKIGQAKEDNGILLLVSLDDKKMRIEVGYGLEGALPDAASYQIINNTLKPAFQTGNYYVGINQAVDEMMAATRGEYTVNSNNNNQSGGPGDTFANLGIWFVIFGFYLIDGVWRFLAKSRAWWQGGVFGSILGLIIAFIFLRTLLYLIILPLIFLVLGFVLDYLVSQVFPKPKPRKKGGSGVWFLGGGSGRGGFGGGGFGGFGGGGSGGGGSSGSW